MSVLASEIVIYGSTVMAEDDTTGSVGGSINTAIKMEFTDISPSGTVEMLSSAVGDTTQTVTIHYRDTQGVLTSEQKTVNGTSVVAFTSTMERIMKVVMSATATGTVTIRKSSVGATLVTMEPGITQVRRPFYNVSAPATGSKIYMEKVFCRNNNTTTALTSATIAEQADPSTKITFAVAPTLEDTATTTNRITDSTALTFDNTTKSVANSGNLTATSAQGVWLKLSLNDTDVATKTTYTLRVQGNTI